MPTRPLRPYERTKRPGPTRKKRGLLGKARSQMVWRNKPWTSHPVRRSGWWSSPGPRAPVSGPAPLSGDLRCRVQSWPCWSGSHPPSHHRHCRRLYPCYTIQWARASRFSKYQRWTTGDGESSLSRSYFANGEADSEERGGDYLLIDKRTKFRDLGMAYPNLLNTVYSDHNSVLYHFDPGETHRGSS